MQTMGKIASSTGHSEEHITGSRKPDPQLRQCWPAEARTAKAAYGAGSVEVRVDLRSWATGGAIVECATLW